MKKIILGAFTLLCLNGTAMADITLRVSPEVSKESFAVRTRLIDDMLKPRMERPEPRSGEALIKDGKSIIPVPADGNSEITFFLENPKNETIVIYAAPGDDLTLDIKGLSPLIYSVSGSKLMEDISKLDMAASSLLSRYEAMIGEGNRPDEETINRYEHEYSNIYKDYLAANRDAQAVAYAIMQLDGEDFLNFYNNLSETEKSSIIAPLLNQQKIYVEKSMAAEKRMAELQSGNVDAPDFTFNNAEGNPVSLSDFRGKWVVIDFWGTWCPWCIKGFPALKQAYIELQPKLEILGVACNDKYEAWLNGLKKYELPWVNVYNPEKGGGKILEDYAVEGFPTKVIVSPEGKIMNITAGENPEFFEILNNLVK